MTPWPQIDWSQTLAGNDEEGDCGPVSLANLVDLVYGPPLVERTEVERLYTVASGWTAENPGSDNGVVLEALIDDWIANGWPADPTIQPTAKERFAPRDIEAALAKYPACPSAIMLTGDQDFSDTALTKARAFGHAVLVVQAGPDGVRFVTWGRVVLVSRAWWDAFAREVWGVCLAAPVS